MSNSKFKLLNISALRQIQVLSNTPSYLYKHFKNDVSVRTFADSCSVKDFKDLLSSLAARRRQTGNYQILLYAIAVSLSFKEYKDARPLLEKLKTFDVKWLSRIIALARDAMVITHTKTFDLRSQVHGIADLKSDDPTRIVSTKQSPTVLTKQV